ncbi:MAG: aminotransferase class V-fold PLP-dependent enzyme [Pseudomonadota bacterium]
MIYLNSAGHGLPGRAVRQRIRDYLQLEDDIGPGAAEAETIPAAQAVTGLAAKAINAPAENVGLVGTTTIGWNGAVLNLPLAGRRVLVAPGQWVSDVAVLTRMGAHVEMMPMTPEGHVDMDELARELGSGIGALCMPMVSSLGGERYPVEEIGALRRPEDTYYIIDGAQALGQMPVDVAAINCDVFASTTRKWLRAPRGTALVYVADHVFAHMLPNPLPRIAGLRVEGGNILDKPGIERFSPGAVYVPQRLGLGTALEMFLEDPGAAMAAPNQLAAYVRKRALDEGYTLTCPAEFATAITTLRLPSDHVARIAKRLADADIACAVPSPSCEPMRSSDWAEGGFLRISPHVYNSEADIDAVFETIA